MKKITPSGEIVDNFFWKNFEPIKAKLQQALSNCVSTPYKKKLDFDSFSDHLSNHFKQGNISY